MLLDDANISEDNLWSFGSLTAKIEKDKSFKENLEIWEYRHFEKLQCIICVAGLKKKCTDIYCPLKPL